MALSQPEIRVLGCLLEKQRTTPEQYPLSLNSLRLACNQATNRDPVVRYDEPVIRDALHRLERRGFTRLASGRGSRAIKHRHLLSEALPMSDAEQAVICVLMLRGPQTPGELKQRTERMHSFAGLEEVHQALTALIERELVARLERRPGQKEERYTQLLGPDASPASSNGTTSTAQAQPTIERSHLNAAPAERPERPLPPSVTAPVASSELAALTERVQRLEGELAELRAELSERVP
jgi:uncharacterized protein